MKILKLILLLLAVLVGSNVILAQTVPFCDIRNGQDIICNYGVWDWEIPVTHPNYCKTWAARVTSPASAKGILDMAAPWSRSNSAILVKIGAMQDYTKAKGWVLLKKDFGCATAAVKHPYFILYNRFQGLMRVYVYLNNEAETYNGAIVTMENSSNQSRSIAILSGSEGLMKTPEDYLNNPMGRNEIFNYVIKSNQIGQNQWVVGEFRPEFDPNVKNPSYYGNAIAFSVYGTKDSNVKLAGNIEFLTEAYGFGGNKTEIIKNDPMVQGLKNFLTKGKKVSDFVKNLKLEDELKNIHNNAEAVRAKAEAHLKTKPYFMNPSGNYKAVETINKVATFVKGKTGDKSSLGTILSTVTNVAKSAGGIFGMMGNVVGLLWPDKNETATSEPVFTPTISKGTITLEGTIKTTTSLVTFEMQTPGTSHYSSPDNYSSLPYYDNPLGIFNIQNKPMAIKRNYKKHVRTEREILGCYANAGCISGHQQLSSSYTDTFYNEDYTNYKISNEIIPVYNKAAGLELISVEAALVCQIPKDPNSGKAQYDVFRPIEKSTSLTSQVYDCGAYPFFCDESSPMMGWGDGYYYATQDTLKVFHYNPMLTDILSGKLVMTHFDQNDNGLHTFQTPFYDLKCFKGLELDVRAGTEVYVKIKAVLKKIGENNDVAIPILYVKDYELGVSSDISDNNVIRWSTPSSGNPISDILDLKINTKLPPIMCGNTTGLPEYSNNPCSNLSKIQYDALNSITASNISINNTTSYSTYTLAESFQAFAGVNIDITKTSVIQNNPLVFFAGSEIEFGDYFSAENVYLSAYTGNQHNVVCSSTPIPNFYDGTPNQYNNNAYRYKSFDEEYEQIENNNKSIVFPNPSDGRLSIAFTEIPPSIKLLNAQSQLISELTVNEKIMTIDLSGQPNGIYFLQYMLNGKNEIQKIIVQK
jgi:hypothetical protein